MLFTITLSGPSPGGVSVGYATADDTPGAGHATGGASCDGTADYLTTSGTLNFNADEQVKTVAVQVCADNVSGEPDETFLLNLSSPSNANVTRSPATGTITQTNTAGTLVIFELRTSGPSGAGDHFVELYNNTDTPLTVTASDASAGYGLFAKDAWSFQASCVPSFLRRPVSSLLLREHPARRSACPRRSAWVEGRECRTSKPCRRGLFRRAVGRARASA
ncbi:MAG TPA: Calx-beta domain-containing protein [Pyrinomonadaceae bacterium]|nr:Calx-beta domain-containing protein [Pyrinomonadaceae bacterium]